MHDSLTIANVILRLATEAGRSLTPMQLLKLVYIAHGWMLGLYGRALTRDEVQAWQYGPVIPRLYNATRHCGAGPVNDRLPELWDNPLDALEQDVVRQVSAIYGGMTGPALSRITHAPETPWALTYRPERRFIQIPNDLIAEHYRNLAGRNAHQ